MGLKTLSRESILAYGESSSGKTTALLQIARFYHQNAQPGKFLCISTDDGIRPVLTGEFPELLDSPYVKFDIRLVFSYDEFAAAAQEFGKKATALDWIVVDLGDEMWQFAQDKYVTEIFGDTDKIDFFAQARKSYQDDLEAGKMTDDRGKTKGFGNPFDPRKDWPIITGLHKKLLVPIRFKTRGNLFMMCKTKQLDAANDAPDVVQMFQSVGVKPAGQKHLIHDVDSVIYFRKGAVDPKTKLPKFEMQGIKERGRPQWPGVELANNFPFMYLQRRAGWKVEAPLVAEGPGPATPGVATQEEAR